MWTLVLNSNELKVKMKKLNWNTGKLGKCYKFEVVAGKMEQSIYFIYVIHNLEADKKIRRNLHQTPVYSGKFLNVKSLWYLLTQKIYAGLLTDFLHWERMKGILDEFKLNQNKLQNLKKKKRKNGNICHFVVDSNNDANNRF